MYADIAVSGFHGYTCQPFQNKYKFGKFASISSNFKNLTSCLQFAGIWKIGATGINAIDWYNQLRMKIERFTISMRHPHTLLY